MGPGRARQPPWKGRYFLDSPAAVRILVVEDEERIASFLRTGLEAHGYAVEHVATGAEALGRLRRGRLI
jgi:CheY-like chemotaxis protein